jgi:hypothetical protein
MGMQDLVGAEITNRGYGRVNAGAEIAHAVAANACPWRIRKLRRDRHLEQTAAMVPPNEVV